MSASDASTGDQATVSISVAVEPAVAFEVFTQETDLWWRRGLRYRLAGRRPGSLCFERGAGGRLFESFETSSGTQVHEAGRVTVQHPGWSAIRPGHPARHGVEGAAFSRMIGLWWGDLMTALREFIETRGAD